VYKLVHHRNLEVRWPEFPRSQQILSIATELQRAGNLLANKDNGEAQNAYERAFELLDLTISGSCTMPERYELLRFREMLGHLYFNEPGNVKLLEKLFDVLISLNKDSYNALH
jgi:hypothetical protein